MVYVAYTVSTPFCANVRGKAHGLRCVRLLCGSGDAVRFKLLYTIPVTGKFPWNTRCRSCFLSMALTLFWSIKGKEPVQHAELYHIKWVSSRRWAWSEGEHYQKQKERPGRMFTAAQAETGVLKQFGQRGVLPGCRLIRRMALDEAEFHEGRIL